MISTTTPKVLFVIGVSGCGKTTVGQLLAKALGIEFIDADDYHPQENIDKMSNGIPLNDQDRAAWLDRIHVCAIEHQHTGCVIACSALKKIYRDRLSNTIENNIEWIYLKGSYTDILDRMQRRNGHFMKPNMLQSQFNILEEPRQCILVNTINPPQEIVKKIINELEMKKAEIGVIGLGVMGKSLTRNLANNNFKVAMYNRHVDGTEENIAVDFKTKYTELAHAHAYDDLPAFIASLETPRKIILMVNAGPAVDAVLGELKENLEEGDIVIDGGNSHYLETNRRIDSMRLEGMHFIGTGVSGGEKGALIGPSIMPSGDKEAYTNIQKYLEAIAAKDHNDLPCCTYIGRQGSGHFVKMIHNGIEYAEMQLLAECYFILKNQGLMNEEIADTFEAWMEDLGSYLLSITIDILRKKEGQLYLIDIILDQAANKGTGKWATSTIADSGEPATMIPAALFARYLSFFKEKRQQAASIFNEQSAGNTASKDDLKNAYRFSQIINHHQGFTLIKRVSDQNDWQVDLSEIARIWTAGCIIKSDFMKKLVHTLQESDSILFDSHWSAMIKELYPSIQEVSIQSIRAQLHIPCILEALNFYNGIKTADCSANLIQAQRDYFGAHTYKKKGDDSGISYHTQWE
jgi:6-phosphogluconate dehydrogenase